MKLVSAVAVVTGAAQGIGFGIASQLMQDGANVLLFGRTAEKVKAAAESLNRSLDGRARAIPFAGDVSVADDVARSIDVASKELGTPGILVNNAGTVALAPIVDMPEEDFDRVIAVNLKGTFLLIKAFARALIAAKKPGAIVNISSLHQTVATDGMAPYCASKGGMGQLTKVAASELARHEIRVNAVAPGLIRTPLAESAGLTQGRMLQEFTSRTPLGRVGEPDDVAPVVSFLCSDNARWITGETILVDGGTHIRGLHSYLDTLAQS